MNSDSPKLVKKADTTKRFMLRPMTVILGLVGVALLVAFEVIASHITVNSPASSSPSVDSNSIALAYDPADDSLLKADQGGLLRWQASTGWEKVSAVRASNLSGVVVNPDKPTTLYISGVGLGMARSDDGGNNWQAMNTGLPSLDVTALALHSFQRETLFAWVRGAGVYRTTDGGLNWVRMRDQGPPDTNVNGLVHSTLPGSMNTGWLYADTPTGAYLSMDCF